MSERRAIPDLGERSRALDPSASFIVQAPAGSGKTELLIQRFLVLLARVARPEEILAITFTRKAAAEMRGRIAAALVAARSTDCPGEPHEAMTWTLAKAALARSDALGWRIEESAARLRVQTIDALCASLTRQMPVLAKFGAQPESLEDARPLYREAARATLAMLEQGGEAADDAARLLAHLDNDVARAEDLLTELLQRREHWLRYLEAADQREALEASLAAIRREAVARAAALYRAAVPGAAVGETEEAWIALGGELLTKKGGWRKNHKLARTLADRDELLSALRVLRALPPARYSDAQWEALGALTRLARLAAGELKVVFAAHGQADFTEISQGAILALETGEGPTDLLLSLDYRIHHILVDEFQDTSFTQFLLLAKLTAGWEPGDGRTLLVVGDPMQSIYRFREAEVGLFLKARNEGIGGVALEPLALSANFRSQSGIVDWVNEAFPRILPAREDIAAGAVTYAASRSVHGAQGPAVTVHPYFGSDVQAEGTAVARLAAEALAAPGREPGEPSKVAILVRTRSHLAAVIPALRAAGLAFRAIEIEPLGHRPVVQDLLALARALAHLADRTAWLAILRAPWCGLALADLHALAAPEEDGAAPSARAPAPTIWESMHDEARLRGVSAEARARLARTRGVLAACLANRFRGSLRAAVEGAWLALGGPACVEDATDLEDAAVFLDHLEASEAAGAIADPAAFEEGLAELKALPDLEASECLQVMTIHKAKGLEFDAVIVPGLGSGAGRDERKLFLWMERAASASGGEREGELLLAPINPAGGDDDPIYDYIRALDKAKSDLENGRLLYVAATRARKTLHLTGHAKIDKDGLPRPAKGSLLAKLWPVVESDFARAAESVEESARTTPAGIAAPAAAGSLGRLAASWTVPPAPPAVAWAPPPETPRVQDEVEFSWVGETLRRVGSVVHRWMQRFAQDGLAAWSPARVAGLGARFREELSAQGVEPGEVGPAADRVAAALANALEDERGRWLLGAQRDARNEYRIEAIVGGVRRRMAIDRCFTAADGRAWIVDYKTSSHEGADLEAFLEREKARYRSQLLAYAAALGGERSLGLYFPMVRGWREVAP